MGSHVELKSCLHLVTRSSGDALERCQAVCAEQDEVLLIDDAVMRLVHEGEGFHATSPAALCFLRADLDARGLAAIADELGARVVTDQGFVEMLRKHESCLTWK